MVPCYLRNLALLFLSIVWSQDSVIVFLTYSDYHSLFFILDLHAVAEEAHMSLDGSLSFFGARLCDFHEFVFVRASDLQNHLSAR